MIELTKAQKKIVRTLIDEALRRDYVDGISRVKQICDEFDKETSDPKKVYHELFSVLDAKDKEIGRRYDGLTGSKYFVCLLGIMRESVLPVESLDALDDELRERILFLMNNLA